MKRGKITLGWRARGGQQPTSCQDDYIACADEPEHAPVPATVTPYLKVSPWEAPSPLDTCLDYWSTWMGKPDLDLDTQLGANRSAGCENPHQRRETEIAEAVDAMIESLKPIERWAIYRRCGISTQWRFPNADFGEVVARAEQSLTEKLRKNIATRALF